MNVPDFMPQLRYGAGQTPQDGGCLVQVAGFLNDGVSWTDSTPCVHPMLREVAIGTNDRVDDVLRQTLLPLAPRLIGTGLTGDEAEDRRVTLALVEWCVRQAAVAAHAIGGIWASNVAVDAKNEAALYASGASDLNSLNSMRCKVIASLAADAHGEVSPEALADFLVRMIDEYDRVSGREMSGKTVRDGDWKRVTEHIKAPA